MVELVARRRSPKLDAALITRLMIWTNYEPNRASAGEQIVAWSRCVGARLFLPALTKKLETFAPSRRACDVSVVTGVAVCTLA
jgi:hypothetical protein